MAFFFKRKKKPSIDLSAFEVPSFSASVINLLGKLRDPHVSINDLVSELEKDPGLYLRVLKMVNSAAFGLSRKISSIQHATNLLGRSRLEALVLTVAVKNNLADNRQQTWLNMSEFWKASSLRASVAKALAQELHPKLQSDVFTIGLLQDMAIPLLATQKKPAYRDVYQQWLVGETDINLAEEENKLFGIDHMTLGAHMAETWKFPPTLIAAIGDHHDFDSAELPLSTKIAALISRPPASCDSEALAERAAEVFDLKAHIILPSIERAFEHSSELANALE